MSVGTRLRVQPPGAPVRAPVQAPGVPVRVPVQAPGAPVRAPVRVRLQLLPCGVRFCGAAPVDAFLGESGGESGDLWASFRGRRLGGRELPLPHGYQGLVLRAGGDPQEPWVTATGTFDRITDWGADTVPSPNVGLALALQWGPVAAGIHAPVPEEEVEP